MDGSKKKPCPHCGGEIVFRERTVVCPDCGSIACEDDEPDYYEEEVPEGDEKPATAKSGLSAIGDRRETPIPDDLMFSVIGLLLILAALLIFLTMLRSKAFESEKAPVPEKKVEWRALGS